MIFFPFCFATFLNWVTVLIFEKAGLCALVVVFSVGSFFSEFNSVVDSCFTTEGTTLRRALQLRASKAKLLLTYKQSLYTKENFSKLLHFWSFKTRKIKYFFYLIASLPRCTQKFVAFRYNSTEIRNAWQSVAKLQFHRERANENNTLTRSVCKKAKDRGKRKWTNNVKHLLNLSSLKTWNQETRSFSAVKEMKANVSLLVNLGKKQTFWFPQQRT